MSAPSAGPAGRSARWCTESAGRLPSVQIPDGGGGLHGLRVGIGAQDPVRGAGSGDAEPVVLVLVVVQPVVSPHRAVDPGDRPVIAVNQVVRPLVAKAQ